MDKILYYDHYLSGLVSMRDCDPKKTDVAREDSPNDDRKALLRRLLVLLEYSGHGIPWICGTMLMICMEKDMPSRQFYVNLLFALILDLAIIGVLKVAVRRPRPVYNVDDMFATVSVDRYAFPSGHSTRAVMVIALLVTFWTHTTYMILGVVWVSAIAVSRVVLGRHHISDVVAGLIIGYLQYLIVLKLWLSQETCLMLMEYQPLVY